MGQGDSHRNSRNAVVTRRRLVAALGALAVAWAVFARWLVPAVIRSAYRGESLPILNRMISGQARNSVEVYLGLWSSIAIRVSVALAAIAAFAWVAWEIRGRLPEWRAVERANPQPLNEWHAVLFAAWIGIIGGLCEAVNGILRHRIQHMPTGEIVSGELLWMAPLTAVAILVPAAVLAMVARRTLRVRLPAAVVATFLSGVAASYSLTFALRIGIAWYAALILSLGVGSALGRAVGRYPRVLYRLARRSTMAMVASLSVWAIVVPISRRVAERRAVAALPPPDPGAPNVLVMIWDAVRAQDLSLYGYERETTPEVSRLASRGIVFNWAFATAPFSLPSHASIFTGRYPNELTAARQIPLDGMYPTIAESLSARGYVTGGFTANLFFGSADYGLARGFTWYDARPPIRIPSLMYTWWLGRELQRRVANAFGNHDFPLRRHAAHVNDSFLAWRRRHTDRPFLAILNNFDAHEPYLPPAPFNLAFSATPPRYWYSDLEKSLRPALMPELRTAYNTSIRYLDHEMGRLVTELRNDGVLDNTLIVLTADHGEEFGEHGPDVFGHPRSLYAGVLHVPLLVLDPRRPAQAVRVDTPVSIRDIPATIMDFVRGENGETGGFPGIPLLSYAGGDVGRRNLRVPRLAVAERRPWGQDENFPLARSDLFSLVADTLQLIATPSRNELYDFVHDPWEQHDLSSMPAAQPAIARMRAKLDSLVRTASGQWSARRGEKLP